MPKRSAISEFLMIGGRCQSWLIGNKIITITTSGGSAKMQSNGMCEKCNALIRSHNTWNSEKRCPQPGTSKDTSSIQNEKRSSETIRTRPMRQRSKSGNTEETDSSIKVGELTRKGSSPSILDAQKKAEKSRPVSGPPAITFLEDSKKQDLGMKNSEGKDHGPNQQHPFSFTDKFSFQRLSSGSLYQCNCWCRGWAEVHIRRPTGNTSWIMRIQNDGSLIPLQKDLPLTDISSLLLYNREIEKYILHFLPDDSDESDKEKEEEPEVEKGEDTGTAGDDLESNVSKAQEATITLPIPGIGQSTSPPQFLVSPQEELSETVPEPHMHPFEIELHKDLAASHLTVSFARPELGLSPHHADHHFLHNQGVVDRYGELAKVLRLLEGDQNGIESFDYEMKFPLHKSPSAPSLLPLFDEKDTERRKKYSSICAVSPRSISRSCMNDTTQRPSSYKDMSYLEKRYSKELEDCISLGQKEAVDCNKEEKKKKEEDREKKEVQSQETGISNMNETVRVVAFKTERKKSTEFVLDNKEVEMGEAKKGEMVQGKGSREIQSEESAQEKNYTLSLGSSRVVEDKPYSTHSRLRQRGHTFSAVSKNYRPEEKKAQESSMRKISETRSGLKESFKSSMDPSFVFLQLYYSPFMNDNMERPIAVPINQVAQRAVKVLDRIPPYDTHKIGVVYVGPDQVEDEIAILSNVYGSSRYMSFLQGLGKLIPLQEAARIEVYTGGLDTSGNDGKFVYWWKDDIMQVIFHVATLMPNKESDPNYTAKKLHIGNDFVSIVYNDSGQNYKLGTMKGQFNFAEIIIEPLDKETNLVSIQAKPELEDWIGARGPWMVSDNKVALLVRQMALHANLASLIHKSQVRGNAASSFSSNWLERLRQVNRIRSKVAIPFSSTSTIDVHTNQNSGSDSSKTKTSAPLVDFSLYT